MSSCEPGPLTGSEGARGGYLGRVDERRGRAGSPDAGALVYLKRVGGVPHVFVSRYVEGQADLVYRVVRNEAATNKALREIPLLRPGDVIGVLLTDQRSASIRAGTWCSRCGWARGLRAPRLSVVSSSFDRARQGISR